MQNSSKTKLEVSCYLCSQQVLKFLLGSKNNKKTYQANKNTKIHAANFSYYFCLNNIPLIHTVVPF